MNYDHVLQQVDDDDEEVQLQPHAARPAPLDLKHKILYTCVGVVLTGKVLFICWIFTLSFPSDALSKFLHW